MSVTYLRIIIHLFILWSSRSSGIAGIGDDDEKRGFRHPQAVENETRCGLPLWDTHIGGTGVKTKFGT